jgi:hypothetical protein
MKVRMKVRVKAFEHATILDSLIVTTINGKNATRIEHWCGKLPKWVSHLHTWGESRTVKTKIKTTPKLADRGIQYMFVGHFKDQDGDCFDMYYPKTNSVYTTRDVIWLSRMYYTEPIEEGAEAPLYLDADSAATNASDQLQINQAGDEKSGSTHDSSDESSDVDPEIECDDDETKSIVASELQEAETIPGGTLRSGKTFRDIAALNVATNPIKISTAEVEDC